MSCITRCVMRWGLIGALGLGGLTLLVGPERVGAGLAQIRTKAQGVVDRCVDDPVALRRQLEQLADEYPDRIAEVEGQLAAIGTQIEDLEYDVNVSTKVVADTTEDMQVLRTRLAKADAAIESGNRADRAVFIRFEGIRFDLDEARLEALRIGNVRKNHRDRLAYMEQQLKLFGEQKTRLTEILDKLSDDYETYQVQLMTLNRQIDAIQRNERLVELTEQQQQTLAGYDRYARVGNLQQFESQLNRLIKEQEARLAALDKRIAREDYEARARFELEQEAEAGLYDEFMVPESDEVEETPAVTNESVAWAGPLVIE